MSQRTRPPEVGTFVHFEHVNFRVDDHRPATLYFLQGLGFTREPYRMVGGRNMWVNVGLQQFHLPMGEPSPFPGEVSVAVPDLARVKHDLEAIAPQLKGTAFACVQENGTLATRDPWGHAVRVHDSHKLPGHLPQSIPQVTFHVPPGTAEGIARFYRETIGCPAEVAGRKGAREASIQAGPHQRFVYAERKGAEHAPKHNNHVAVYLNRYWELYEALGERNLIMEPVGVAIEQFRFSDIVDLDSGDLLYRIEHEMRSLYHPDFRKPLVNRIPVPYPVD
ncbi:MAG TPA: hypothetical protein VGC20_09095 [bacterium]